MLELDQRLFYLINHGWASPTLDVVFPFATHLQNFVPAIAVLVLWLVVFGGRRGRLCLLALVVTIAVTDPLTVRLLKPAVARERPCVSLEDVRLLVSMKASWSFPSAHAVNTFGAAAVTFGHYRRIGWGALGLAAVVSLSRVYVGVHWPLDVLAGAALGGLLGWVVLRVLRAAGRRWPILDARGGGNE